MHALPLFVSPKYRICAKRAHIIRDVCSNLDFNRCLTMYTIGKPCSLVLLSANTPGIYLWIDQNKLALKVKNPGRSSPHWKSKALSNSQSEGWSFLFLKLVISSGNKHDVSCPWKACVMEHMRVLMPVLSVSVPTWPRPRLVSRTKQSECFETLERQNALKICILLEQVNEA